ncbi:TlpA family protein disulfide reductase [Thermoactinomyces mirandus]|uniref:TlpA family protein disulfide reductase n=1 Tax=Thermoactinomyces mirandus TaxID=2756294 RepID=A0A7W1XRG1_9BACL|nr:TlpA disulfide reductase family protein [Thermoactinomyces mirandus]MBA4601929.1 TlpA family protein disulfide reductase [Thermoactinomyces mirandus]
MNWRNLLIGILIVIAVGGAFWTANSGKGDSPNQTTSSRTEQASVQRDESPQEKMKAPDFTLQTLDGKTVQLSKNGGKPSLINFWASWCPPCKVEMPYIQKAYEKYGNQVNFMMVNLTAMDDKAKMEQFLKEGSYDFPVLLDETGKVGEMYQAFSIPTTYIVDENGIIINHIMGAMSESQLTEIMEKISE